MEWTIAAYRALDGRLVADAMRDGVIVSSVAVRLDDEDGQSRWQWSALRERLIAAITDPALRAEAESKRPLP